MRLIDAVMRDTKYIRADLFMHRIANETLLSPSELTLIKCVMEQEPGEDVKPVVHAHWNVIDHGEEIVNAYPHYWATLKCSNCGVERDVEDYYSPSFCENCGAKMDEEGKDD